MAIDFDEICSYNIITFKWDEHKNQTNIKKHGVSFDEAKTVFLDPNAKVIHDPDHSITEDRFVILGISERMRILVVCHCFRDNDNTIRIISARKASKYEAYQYNGD